ncbi:MAG TPA: SDR family NAD(P)-dependent oxidoreductase, partial [Terriglobia bacterium]|nr:SDR family NAD(P)-dependent oxidoreductase [Terriglobia bacterium]
MKLKNRVAVITGANRGLGEVIARTFAEEGAGLVLAARDGELMQRVAQSLPHAGDQRVEWLQADVSVSRDIEAIRERAIASFGRVDILVNNAGVYGPIGS